MTRVSLSIRRTSAAMLLGVAGGSMAAAAYSLLGAAPSAFADSSAYELYCPNTPVGTIVLNGAVTSGKISPATIASGTQFNLTNFQTVVAVPAQIVQAAAALGNMAVMGSASASVDATGATPATISSGTIPFNAPIPSPIPTNGVTLQLPATPATVGPFTATGGAVTLSLNSTANLNVSVTPGSPPLSLTCKTYPNNAIPTSGITTSAPPGSPVAPQIATASATAAAASPPTTAPPAQASSSATTAPPTAAATSTPAATAVTGPGQQLWLVAMIGMLLVAVGFFSYLVGPGGRGPARGRLRFADALWPGRSAAHPVGSRLGRLVSPFSRAPSGPADLWIDPHVASPPHGAVGGPSGLWIDGGEPDPR